MSEFLHIMIWPFLACLVLTGIHAYLGLHVIERQVIFVDLALAQIAALGANSALLWGLACDGAASYWLSLGFTVAGAAIFSLTRFRHQRVPQEAVIGIVYAVSAALLILILSRSGEGDEHIRHALVGNVLLVTPAEIAKILVIYAAVGLFHYIYRDKFILISRNPDLAYAKGWNVRLWDFLFYATFGIVVTSSVQIAGVFVVFSFLIVPAVAAMLYCTSVHSRLLFGWACGVVASLLGMTVSYVWDFPTGASVVCAFGAVLAALALLRRRLT